MSLFVGIVGLPNVGKSSLFSTITKKQVLVENYPFATIEPNVGVVNVPDLRLEKVAALINPDKLVHATCNFIDIAGLVKGASNGDGLGNAFLSNIKEADVICHVVRCFNDPKIIHVYQSVDPIRDIEIINLELIMADLETLERKLERSGKKLKVTGKKEDLELLALYESIRDNLKESKMIKDLGLSDDELFKIKSDNFLTAKKTLYIANVNEEQVSEPSKNENYVKVFNYVKSVSESSEVLPLSVNMELEISKLDHDEKNLFMKDMGIQEMWIDQLIHKSYKLLGLSTFFTFGKKETRAWTFKTGWLAPQCAGVIHSDFERGFIKADVISWNSLVECGSEVIAKEKGLVRSEGKKYTMQDGDVCNFKFNV